MNILVVEARGLHIGYLGCYGNDWIATPNLDRLAAEGVVFDRHYHDCPDMAASSLTSSGMSSAAPRLTAIAGFGQAALAAFRRASDGLFCIQGPDLAPPWQLPAELADTYFDEEADEGEPWPDPPTAVVDSLTLDEQIELQNTYAAVVTWFDAQLGILLDGLRDSGELDATLVCVTANAGLPLGEHGEIGSARAWLHEERVHVPLLMRFPKQKHAGLRIAALTQPPDLMVTLHGLLGRANPAVIGHELLPLLRAEVAAVRPHACSHLAQGDSGEWALRTAQWALLLPMQVPDGDAPRSPQLYIKPDDRWEVNDVRQQNLELAEDLERTLRSFMEQAE